MPNASLEQPDPGRYLLPQRLTIPTRRRNIKLGRRLHHESEHPKLRSHVRSRLKQLSSRTRGRLSEVQATYEIIHEVRGFVVRQ